MLIVLDRIPGLRVRQVPVDPAPNPTPMLHEMEFGLIGPRVYDPIVPIVPIVLIALAASILKMIGQGLNQDLSG